MSQRTPDHLVNPGLLFKLRESHQLSILSGEQKFSLVLTARVHDPDHTTVPSTFVPWKKSGIFPSDRRIFPVGTGIKLDLCFCIIPTVGLYGKLGEVTATHN